MAGLLRSDPFHDKTPNRQFLALIKINAKHLNAKSAKRKERAAAKPGAAHTPVRIYI